jgi:uroporphyrinogen decarboxylase
MAMTARERLLCALELGQPDRLPATTHAWMDYHLQHTLGGMDALSAYRRFGLDAALQVPHVQPTHSADWVVSRRAMPRNGEGQLTETKVKTPEGELHWTEESDEYTSWVTEYPIKHVGQIRLIERYWPVPGCDHQALHAAQARLGEDGIIRGFGWGFQQAGPWQDACRWVGTERMILLTHDDPAWVHEFLRILTDKKLQFIETMENPPVDLVETGGGDASSTVISPAIFEEFCLPYDRPVHDALHDAGLRVVYHTCGGMMPLLEMIVGNGCDAMETLTPPEMGGDVRLAEVKRRVGGQVCLIGGFDQFHGLRDGTPAIIREMVHRCFEEAGPGGGYVMATSDHFFHASEENLQAYADAARECVY